MKKSLIAIPARPSNTLEYFTLHQEKSRNRKPWWTFRWFLGDRDFRKGRCDARISPSICHESINGIEQEEQLEKEKIQNVLEQNIRDARETLSQFPELKEQSKRQIDEMRERGSLLPEVESKNLKGKAAMTRLFANLLLVIEMCGLFAVAKVTFGNGVIGAFCTAVLFVATITIVTKLTLARAKSPLKWRLFWGAMISGAILALTGMVGFAILRATTFNASLMGGTVDFGQLSLGNCLLMIGLTLGVPLIIGAMHDDASENHTKSSNSLDLYEDRKELDECEAAWKRVLGKLEEYQQRMEEITNRIIKNRQSSYRQGFHRGAAGKPDAAPYLKEMMEVAG